MFDIIEKQMVDLLDLEKQEFLIRHHILTHHAITHQYDIVLSQRNLLKRAYDT